MKFALFNDSLSISPQDVKELEEEEEEVPEEEVPVQEEPVKHESS